MLRGKTNGNKGQERIIHDVTHIKYKGGVILIFSDARFFFILVLVRSQSFDVEVTNRKNILNGVRQ